MNRRLLLLFAGLLAGSASAVVVDVNLPFKELRLRDGMLFTDVALRSVNTATGTVMLLVNKDLISVRTSMLPEDVTGRLKDLTPVLSKEDEEAERQQEAADRKRAAETADRRQRLAEDEAAAIRAASRSLNVKAAEESAAKIASLPDEVAKFAEERARIYFKYQADPHSNIGAVIGSDIYLENPEPVPGWTGRYRVEGKAYRQYINNRSSGFDRDHKDFDMLIQTHEDKKPEIVELRIK